MEPVLDVKIFFFVFLGVIGAAACALRSSSSYKELGAFVNVQRVLMGAIMGFIYYFLWSDYDFPNTVMCILAGYTGTDVLDGIIEKYREKKKKATPANNKG